MDSVHLAGPVSNPVKHTEEHEQSAMNPDATYVVDWDGHDDPKNPKKCVSCNITSRLKALTS